MVQHLSQKENPKSSCTKEGPTLVWSRSSRKSVLGLWHLLSLDAPSVAALWTIFIARCAGVTLPWKSPAAMFVAVWMLYAADRLLDARGLSPQVPNASDLEERHRFHHRHARAFLAGIGVAAITLTWLLQGLDTKALRLYVLLAALLVAWFLLIHVSTANALSQAGRLPKELAVGIFFPAAVFIPTVARAPWLRLPLLPAAGLLSAICILNCLWIYAWEHPHSRERAHWTTQLATLHLRSLTLATLMAGCGVAIFSLTQTHRLPPILMPIALSCTLSASLFLLLDARRDRLSTLHLRAAADLVLLTPLLTTIGLLGHRG